MRRRIVQVLVGGVAIAAAAPAWAGRTELVSVSSTGEQADGESNNPTISANGRFVAFGSLATNLVSGDSNGFDDVFVRDRVDGVTILASISTDGTHTDGPSYLPTISADGRFVAFYSDASNLVPDDTNGMSDVFVHDLWTKTTTRASISTDGVQANERSSRPRISPDGRFVAFQSWANNLVPKDTNGVYDVFVRDQSAKTTERVSVSSSGAQANGNSQAASISLNGTFVTFTSTASNLVEGDNHIADVFVRNRLTKTTERVSVSPSGAGGNGLSGSSWTSSNGRYVVFNSKAINLVKGDTNGMWDAFVRDLLNRTTKRVSVSSGGIQSNGGGDVESASSSNGRYVTFSSAANLVPEDTNDSEDVFVHDLWTKTTTRVSISTDGVQTEKYASSSGSSISADGRFVAFGSWASSLVPGDTNGRPDIFVRTR